MDDPEEHSDGVLVGRLDPKLHRDRGLLEVKGLFLETGFEPGATFTSGLRASLEGPARFVGATELRMPEAEPSGRS